MANLATVASRKVNGVAALHSRLLRETVLADFAELCPERFTNVTNGVTPRRFVGAREPAARARCITEAIGDGWLTDLDQLQGLEPIRRGRRVPRALARGEAREQGAARRVDRTTRKGVRVDPHTLFDAQCKRIHEYKRQHLNAAARRLALPAHPPRRARGHRAAHGPVRGEGGAGLPDGEAHHPPRHGRRARPSSGDAGRARNSSRRLRARLQREERPAHLPGGGPVGADLDRGHGGVRHRQHEVRA